MTGRLYPDDETRVTQAGQVGAMWYEGEFWVKGTACAKARRQEREIGGRIIIQHGWSVTEVRVLVR